MDRIVVRTNDDMSRVLDWAEELRGLAVELPFPEGEIEFQEEEWLLKFREVEHGLVDFELFTHGNQIVSWRSDLESGDIPELHIAGSGEQKMKLGLLLSRDDTVAKMNRKFRGIMLFAAYYREEVVRTRKVTRRNEGSGSGKRSNRRKLTLRTYEIGSGMLSELPAPKKMWKGYAESFGVRGHYRRYRTGKVVWVRPYEKKGRNEKKSDKEYVL